MTFLTERCTEKISSLEYYNLLLPLCKQIRLPLLVVVRISHHNLINGQVSIRHQSKAETARTAAKTATNIKIILKSTGVSSLYSLDL